MPTFDDSQIKLMICLRGEIIFVYLIHLNGKDSIFKLNSLSSPSGIFDMQG